MIGVFAKKFAANERVTEITDAEGVVEVKSHSEGVQSMVVGDDEPPKAFVEKVAYEGGNVYVIPFIEAFRTWIRRMKEGEDETESGKE